jgi:hypothetical protein
MRNRIYNVLLIASKYDAFMLEDDGRVEEQIFNEYVSLNLRYPPRFTQVSTEAETIEELKHNNFELIIFMPGDKQDKSFEIAKKIKVTHNKIPIVVLTPFSREVSKYMANADLSAIDYVFSWLGNTDLLLAIIKLVEDKMNVEQDIKTIGVRVILLVEDSVRFYSSILSDLYNYILEQSRNFATEALNEHQQMLRMRGRPKILLARSYEEANMLYQKYEDNMLGVISDMSFNREGQKDKQAGLLFCRKVRNKDPFLPIILNSSDCENSKYASELGSGFINKASKTFPQELRKLLTDTFGFGDFVFKDPDTGKEIIRIRNLKDFQEQLFRIPDNSLRYHLSRNHASRWLYSRAIFPLAKFIEKMSMNETEDTSEVRKFIFDAIVMYRQTKNQGIIAEFKKDRFDKYSNFVRYGEGSLGGKGRGLAFIDALIKRNMELGEFEGVNICIPKTLVLCTEIFDQFMENNDLYKIALSDASDDDILKVFIESHLPDGFNDNLKTFLSVVRKPIAIRSSSLLEDSHYQPFAGIYSTYMIPFNEDIEKSLSMLKKAIKGVYASVFFQRSKAYMTATSNVIDQEKMSIILEEVVGTAYGERYYPDFSGVARSLNYYPIGHETSEDGIANVALGLGKYIVDGGVTLRFSPKHPHSILQMSSLDYALRETQTYFLCLDLKNEDFQLSTDDGQNLLKVNVQDAEKDGTLKQIVSTYDHTDQVLRDGIWGLGRKVVSFAHILQNETFPLANILESVLFLGQKEMGRPVEIEFAVQLNPDENGNSNFYLLQIRPIVDAKEMLEENIEAIPKEQTILKTDNALGQGIENDVYDLIYIKPETFQASNNQQTAYEIDKINRQLTKEGRGYVLIGPGRWGSSDPWLGIPVKWSNIASTRLIVEADLSNYKIDPSQGTHFFQNLTSFGVNYYNISNGNENDFIDYEYLKSQPAFFENEYFRHLRFNQPIVIKTDGKKNYGVLLKPVTMGEDSQRQQLQ